MSLRFNYTPDILARFLEGECGVLALELHRLTGWPIYAVYMLEPGENVAYSIPAHYVIKTPNEMFLDIIGLRTADELAQELPVQLNLPMTKVYLKPTDQHLDNPDYVCEQEDLLYAHVYAQDILRLF